MSCVPRLWILRHPWTTERQRLSTFFGSTPSCGAKDFGGALMSSRHCWQQRATQGSGQAGRTELPHSNVVETMLLQLADPQSLQTTWAAAGSKSATPQKHHWSRHRCQNTSSDPRTFAHSIWVETTQSECSADTALHSSLLMIGPQQALAHQSLVSASASSSMVVHNFRSA